MMVSVFGITAFAEPVVNESWTEHAASGFDGGNGTESDPYRIATAEQLAYLSTAAANNSSYLEYHYVLTENINIGAYSWTPIKSGESMPFEGVFDGNNRTITGLTISGFEDNTSVGLFSGLGAGAVVKDLKFSDVAIDVSSNSVGTLAGSSTQSGEYVTVYNVDVLSGSVHSDRSSSYSGGVGGIIGEVGSKVVIYDCSNAADVSATANKRSSDYRLNYTVGGIVGSASTYTNISGCRNTGNISAESTVTDSIDILFKVGGISGTSAIIYNSSNSGDVTIAENSVRSEENVTLVMGGISNDAVVTNSYNSGTITYSGATSSNYDTYFGGIMGGLGYASDKASATNCVNSGEYVTSIDKNIDSKVNFYAISYVPTYNSYWTDTISEGNRPVSSEENIVMQSGSFDAAGALTSASYSTGTLLGATLTTALNSWVTDNRATETTLPQNWVTDDTATNGPVKHQPPLDTAVTVTDDNGMVNDATITLYTLQGVHIHTASVTDGTATITDILDDRYHMEISADGRLTLSTLLEKFGGSAKSYKLITPTTPTVSNNVVSVDSIGDLAYISQQVNSGEDSYDDKTVKLTKDIDLTGYDWTPIGFLNPYDHSFAYTARPFKGVFDGNGKTITGISASSLGIPIGLFGLIDAAEIKNLTLNNVSMSGYSHAAAAVVGVSINNEADDPVEIRDVMVSQANISTLIGGDVDGERILTPYVGGIAGKFIGGIMENCTIVSGSISNMADNNSTAGGLVGINRDRWDNAIGLYADTSVKFNNLINRADVSSLAYSGGIIGTLNTANSTLGNTIDNSHNYGTVTGFEAVGGIIGDTVGLTASVSFCSNNGEIFGNGEVPVASLPAIGGIIGKDDTSTTINACTNNADISVAPDNFSFKVGGIMGSSNGGSIMNCTNNASISAIGSDITVTAGGIIGYMGDDNGDRMVINNLNAGSVTIDQNHMNGDIYLGGIAGQLNGGRNYVVNLRNNYNYGTVGISNATPGTENCLGTLIGILSDHVTASNNYAAEQNPVAFIYNYEFGSSFGNTILSGNGTFASTDGVLTLLTGSIPTVNEITYSGVLLDDDLLGALNAYVADSTLNPEGKLYDWKVSSGQSSGYPILNIPMPPNYDANGDGTVNAEDIKIALKVGNYNKPATSAINPEADMNKDGYINFLDIAGARNSYIFNMG